MGSLLNFIESAGPFVMLAFGLGAILCLHVWLPISTFTRNPIASILAFFVPIVGIVLGALNFQVAKYPLVIGSLCVIGAVGTFILRSLVFTFFNTPVA